MCRMTTVSYTRAERIADATIHLLGVPAGIAAMVSLLWMATYQDSVKIYVACAVYGAGIVSMLGLSAAYNLLGQHPWKEILRRLDHAAIFVMIAGSYTPVALLNLERSLAVTLLGIVWSIALVGIAIKLRYPRRFERLSIGLYLLQGWTILLAIRPMLDATPPTSLILLGVGALLYTVGVVFHLSVRLPFHNAIWHGLVLAGAGCHFAMIMSEVAVASQAV
jgi:hemolysin III